MAIGVVADEQLYTQIKKLNFRGGYDIRWLKPTEPTVICRTLEADHEFTDVLIDVAGIKTANTDEVVSLVDRLLRTTQLHILVFADGYLPESRLIRDLVSVGVAPKDIFLQSGVKLQMKISSLLQKDPTAEKVLPRDTGEAEAKGELSALDAVVPPSQVDAATGKSMRCSTLTGGCCNRKIHADPQACTAGNTGCDSRGGRRRATHRHHHPGDAAAALSVGPKLSVCLCGHAAG